jgi:caspase domain-containing protein/TIR domain-containing protein
MRPDRARSASSDDVFERPEKSDPTFDVFLAFNSRDETATRSAHLIFDALEAEEKRVWVDWEDATGGDAPDEIMVDGITDSRCCAMLWGPEGLGNWQGRYELKFALGKSVKDPSYRLFAVRLPGSEEELPDALGISNFADLREGFDDDRLTEDGLVELLKVVDRKSPRKIKAEREARRVKARTSDDPRPRRALLIGVGKYSDEGLSDLLGPSADVAELQKVLESAHLPRSEKWKVTVCPDLESAEFETTLSDFFLDEDLRDGVALFYYSGHGRVHSNDSYLCTTNTKTNNISWTAMAATKIVDLVENCPAASKIVIVDCCQAAALVTNAYRRLGDDAAVILATHGQAEDSATESEPSPFTRELIDVFGDARAYGGAGLSTGDLLAALERRGQKPWTNQAFSRTVLLAAPAGRPEPPPKQPAAGFAIELATATPDDDRLPLVRQLALLLDGLFAVARDEPEIPTAMVRETMDILATELRRLTRDQFQEADDAPGAGDEPPKPCAVSFADDDTRHLLADLPWEYLALCGKPGKQRRAASERLVRPPIAVERLFHVPATKGGGAARPQLQHVVLFSSLRPATNEDVHPLTSATAAQLSVKPELVLSANWSDFSLAPDNADVVILQVPVWLEDEDAKVVFASTRPEDGPDDRASTHVISQLRDRSALTLCLIETVADDPHRHSPAAVRQLADSLAEEIKRPVVAICHSGAYANCVRSYPNADTFLAQLVRKLEADWSLDHAAHAAREGVVRSLGLKDPSIIGFPVVMRPVEREVAAGERAIPRR